MSHDELSTIDEASNYAKSRTPSYRSRKEGKSLPLPPSNEGINAGKVYQESHIKHRCLLPFQLKLQINSHLEFRIVLLL